MSTEPEIYTSVPESEQEAALRQWWAEQQLKSVDNLESAARQIITLCTTLLGVLLGVLALAEDPLPGYLADERIRLLGAAGVAGLLLALLLALWAIRPREYAAAPDLPDEQAEQFAALLKHKRTLSSLSFLCFGAGLAALAAVILLALFQTQP